MGQTVKHLSAMQETQVQSLGREDPLEKKWQSTPVLLPGKFHGWRSLVGYSPWGHKELDTTEQLHLLRQHIKKQRHYFVNKGPSSQSYGFFSGHVWIWELDYKES